MNEFDRNPRIVSAAPSADEPSQPDKPVPFHHGLIGRLRSYFLAGWSWLRAGGNKILFVNQWQRSG